LTSVAVVTIVLLLGLGLWCGPPTVSLPWTTGPSRPAHLPGSQRPVEAPDVVLARTLSARVDALHRSDPVTELQLRLAAHALVADNAAYRTALGAAAVGFVHPLLLGVGKRLFRNLPAPAQAAPAHLLDDQPGHTGAELPNPTLTAPASWAGLRGKARSALARARSSLVVPRCTLR
jgi:hypothetical protein